MLKRNIFLLLVVFLVAVGCSRAGVKQSIVPPTILRGPALSTGNIPDGWQRLTDDAFHFRIGIPPQYAFATSTPTEGAPLAVIVYDPRTPPIDNTPAFTVSTPPMTGSYSTLKSPEDLVHTTSPNGLSSRMVATHVLMDGTPAIQVTTSDLVGPASVQIFVLHQKQAYIIQYTARPTGLKFREIAATFSFTQ